MIKSPVPFRKMVSQWRFMISEMSECLVNKQLTAWILYVLEFLIRPNNSINELMSFFHWSKNECVLLKHREMGDYAQSTLILHHHPCQAFAYLSAFIKNLKLAFIQYIEKGRERERKMPQLATYCAPSISTIIGKK